MEISTHIKMLADALYLNIYSILRNAEYQDKERVSKLKSALRECCDHVRQWCDKRNLPINAVLYNVLCKCEHHLVIDPSPHNPEYTETWEFFMCDDHPEFIILREGTEQFSEISLCATIYDLHLVFESNIDEN